MRRKTAVFMCVVVLVLGLQTAGSQGISFDTTDVKLIFAVGKSITYRDDTLTTSANIGAPGHTSWDFSGLNTTSVSNLESVALASTPYVADFPQARFALRDTGFTYSFYYDFLGTTVTLDGSGFVYYGLTANLLNQGFKGSGNAYVHGNPLPAQGQWLNSPAAVEYALPIQVSSSWVSTYTESISGSADLGGLPLPFGPLNTSHTITYTVDAYGPLTLPGALVQEALRIRKSDWYTSGTTTEHRVSYIFLAENGATVQLTVADTSASIGTVAVSGIRWAAGDPNLPVPIELAGFTATQSGGESVALEWTTVSEVNNFGFYVQRKGADESVFMDVPGAFVGGHGTTIIPQRYGYTDTPGRAGSWWYRLRQVDLDGSLHYSEPVEVNVLTGVEEDVPASFELAQNYPNPFNPSTTIRYGLPSRSAVRLTVFNALGQQIAVLVEKEKDAGNHEVAFDASGLPSGVYIYRLQAGDFVETRSMLLLR